MNTNKSDKQQVGVAGIDFEALSLATGVTFGVLCEQLDRTDVFIQALENAQTPQVALDLGKGLSNESRLYLLMADRVLDLQEAWVERETSLEGLLEAERSVWEPAAIVANQKIFALLKPVIIAAGDNIAELLELRRKYSSVHSPSQTDDFILAKLEPLLQEQIESAPTSEEAYRIFCLVGQDPPSKTHKTILNRLWLICRRRECHLWETQPGTTSTREEFGKVYLLFSNKRLNTIAKQKMDFCSRKILASATETSVVWQTYDDEPREGNKIQQKALERLLELNPTQGEILKILKICEEIPFPDVYKKVLKAKALKKIAEFFPKAKTEVS